MEHKTQYLTYGVSDALSLCKSTYR